MTHLYRYFDDQGTLLYVGISVSAFERLRQHRKIATWFPEASTMTIENWPSREMAKIAETIAIESERPVFNIMESLTYNEKSSLKYHIDKIERTLSLHESDPRFPQQDDENLQLWVLWDKLRKEAETYDPRAEAKRIERLVSDTWAKYGIA